MGHKTRNIMEPIQVYVREGETSKHTPMSPTSSGDESPRSPKFDLKCLPPISQPIAACPLTHQLLMLLHLKQHLLGETRFHFDVHRINVSRAPAEFRRNCLRNVPAIFDPNTDTASDHELEIMEYLEQQYPTPELTVNQAQAEVDEQFRVMKIVSDLFKKFNIYIKQNAKDVRPMMSALQALNDHLVKKGSSIFFITRLLD